MRRRFNTSQRRKEWRKRWLATEVGVRVKAMERARRIRLAGEHYGYAVTPELAGKINAHIRRRLSEFEQRFAARAETESVSAGSVQTETEP